MVRIFKGLGTEKYTFQYDLCVDFVRMNKVTPSIEIGTCIDAEQANKRISELLRIGFIEV